ncbi:MAG: OFA family MFS transporter [Candidatus Eremiobacteraeota bacterium]|nr:OFA family MFS transporter [Candidatus Eremiobacteraeota bacterium]MBV8366602.1 OFA family MFS transporter [Candidatus Eremiobacteraeota bacterium]
MIVMICIGTVYSWSIFTQPLRASFGWSNTTTTWIFALAIFFLGVGAVVGGRWQDRVGPRAVTITGVILWAAGYLLAGLVGRNGPIWMYLTYGVIGGFGNGMAYITPVATVTKWFPDMRGVGSGMVVMGFGLGAFFYNQIVPRIASFKAASAAAAAYLKAKSDPATAAAAVALTPDQVQAILSVFVVSGIVFLIVGTLCALMLNNPPDGYTVPGAKAAAASAGRSYTTGEMLRTGQFYLLWLMLFLNVTAGILVISNAVPIILELTNRVVAGTVDPKTAGTAYGLVAIFNGLGRFFWGSISERIGRNWAFVLIFGIQVVVFFVLGTLTSLVSVLTCFAIVLLCYGGGFGTMPSFNADYFGTKYMGANYGAIITAWGVAGIVGPIFVAYVKDHLGSFAPALPYVAVMLIIAMILPFLARRPADSTAPVAAAA